MKCRWETELREAEQQKAEQDGGHVGTAGMREEAQMSNYVAHKVRANRAGIKNLFQNRDGSSMCESHPSVREDYTPSHWVCNPGTQGIKQRDKRKTETIHTFSSPKLCHKFSPRLEAVDDVSASHLTRSDRKVRQKKKLN